jgi:hypothetical protein
VAGPAASPPPDARAAFERLCIEVVQIEAVISAAEREIDECPPPSSPARRTFERAQALVSSAAEKAKAALELSDELKASLRG